MIFIILFFAIIISLSLFIHLVIEKFSPLIYPYIFWILYELPKIDFSNYNLDQDIIEYYIMISLGAIFYFLGILYDKLLVKKKFYKRLIVFTDFKLFQKISLILFRFSLIYFLYFLVFVADLNLLYFFARRLGDDDIQGLVSSNYFFVLLINISILFQVITITKNYSNLKLIRFLTSIFMVFLFTGSRAYILLPILYIIIDIFSKKRIIYILPIIVVAFLSFSILGSIRSFDDSNDISIEDIMSKSEKYSLGDYQLQLRDEAALKHYKNRELFYGSTYMAIFTSFIPRSILGDYKPDMLDGKIAREVFQNYNAGFPLHPVTESILNFGVIGLFVLFIIGAIFSNFIGSSSSSLSHSISSYILLFTQTGYSTYCVYAFQYLIFIFFISLLTRLKFNLK